MGADMVANIIWSTTEAFDLDTAMTALRDALNNETNRDALAAAATFTGTDLDDLATQVVLADPDADRAWRTKIAHGYRTCLEAFVATLSSRETTQIRVGDLYGWVTGGMTWGDAPSDAYDVWNNLFYNDSEDEWEYGGHPYASLIAATMLVSPRADWAYTGQVAVSGVSLTRVPVPAT